MLGGPIASSWPTANPSVRNEAEPVPPWPSIVIVPVVLPAPEVVSVTVSPSTCGIGFGPKLCSDCLLGSPPYQTPSCDVSP